MWIESKKYFMDDVAKVAMKGYGQIRARLNKLTLLEKWRLKSLTGASLRDLNYYVRELNNLNDFIANIQSDVNQYKVQDFPSFLGDLDMTAATRLYVICRVLRPSTVVETGVASGVSTAFILKALEDSGKGLLYSIDLPDADSIEDKLPEGKRVGWLVRSELKSKWHLTIGRSRDKLPDLLHSVGEVDIFLHDSEHTYENMTFEYSTAWPHIHKGGILLSDDLGLKSECTKAFYDFCRRVNRKPVRFWIEKPRFGGIRK